MTDLTQDKQMCGGLPVAGMEGWVRPCQGTGMAKAPANNQILIT